MVAAEPGTSWVGGAVLAAGPGASWGIEMPDRRASGGSSSRSNSVEEDPSRGSMLLEGLRRGSAVAAGTGAQASARRGWRRSAKFLIKAMVAVVNMSLKVWALLIFYEAKELRIFGMQIGIQCVEVALSVVVTFHDADVRRWLRGSPALVQPLACLVAVAVLGALQFIHVKRAWARQLHVAEVIASLKDQNFLWTGPALGAEPAVPIALLTGVPSAVLSTFSYVVVPHSELNTWVLLGASLSNVIVVAFAVVEVDAAVSAYVAKRWHLDPRQRGSKAGHCQFLYPLAHVAYRVAEVSLRVAAIALLLAFAHFLWADHIAGSLAFGFVVLEYFFGVAVASQVSTKDEVLVVHLLVGVALLLTNVVFFVDMPGYCFPARRVSCLLECWRLVGYSLLALLSAWEMFIGYSHKESSFGFDRWEHFEERRWKMGSVVLGSAGTLFYALRLSPVFRKRGDDLHSAVISGKQERLRKLLLYGAGGVTLDVNGPMKDRMEATPAMLAAQRDDAEALALLLNAGARVDVCDARDETCFHYAARGRGAQALELLAARRGARELLLHRSEELVALLESSPAPLPDAERGQLVALLTPRERRKGTVSHHHGAVSVKPTCVSGNYLGELFPDAVKEEVPPPHELRSVSGLVVAHSAGPLARLALRRAAGAADGSARPLEMLRRTRVLGEGTFGHVIEVELVEGAMSPMRFGFFTPRSSRVWRKQGAPAKRTSLLGSQERLFAMKLQPKATDDTEWRVCSEALALQRVAHPFIVRLVHAFQTPQFFALLLELCAGGDMNKLLCTPDEAGYCGGLPPKRAARYSGQVLLALAHLHEQQRLVYRDLKPENVLLHLESDAAKLADFGSAKYIGSRTRRRMSLVGTQGFLAPELVLGDDDSNAEDSTAEDTDTLDPFLTDAYSFGVTLQLMLLGEDVGALSTDDDGGVWMLPQSGSTEEDRMAALEQACQRGRLTVEARELLSSLLRQRPRQRSHLTDSLIREHEFFLKSLGCRSVSSHLMPPSSP